MKKIKRRSIIKATGALTASSLFKTSSLSSMIIDGIFQSALAQSSGNYLNKKYLYVQQYGAPPRWFFDLPLTPDGNTEKFKSNRNVATRYTDSGGRYTGKEYVTTDVHGIQMPWMWTYNIPTANGGEVPLKKLAEEGMLIMRGTNTNNIAHFAALDLHYRPLGMPSTLTSLSSDYSNAPIGSVNLDTSRFDFRSTKGLSSVKLNWHYRDNPLNDLLSPLNMGNLGSFESDQQKVKSVLESTRGFFDNLIKDRYPGAENMRNATESAISVFGRNFGDLDAEFTRLQAKYQNLIDRIIGPAGLNKYAGINDKPIGTLGSRENTDSSWDYRLDLASKTNKIINTTDIREFIHGSRGTILKKLAWNFAVSEFILINNISSSVTMTAHTFENLYYDGLSQGRIYSMDEHGYGSMITLYTNTMYSLVISSCLYEMISQLKAVGMYDDTVIDLCGEFGRSPQTAGGGSDHSADANSNTIFSGKLDKLSAIGNIKSSSGGQYEKYSVGTWGQQAPNPQLGGLGLLNLGHVAATIASLLEAPNPVTAASSLVTKESSGKYKPILPTGTIT